jgi:hypothetical protein
MKNQAKLETELQQLGTELCPLLKFLLGYVARFLF